MLMYTIVVSKIRYSDNKKNCN